MQRQVLPPTMPADTPTLYRPAAAASRLIPREMPVQILTPHTAAERVNYQRTAEAERTARDCGCDLSAAEQLPVTMGYVPVQDWCNTYDTQTALCRGSLFPELYKPFAGSRGGCYVR